jgi:hypothetical protein
LLGLNLVVHNKQGGKIIAPTIGDTRTEDHFVQHSKNTIDTDPEAGWIFIADNLNTHQSECLVKLVANRLKFADDLGVKGKTDILKNRYRGLIRSEIWFGILTNRLLKRLSSKSRVLKA